MRVAIYARVASAKKINGFSPDTQIQHMQEYAERNGLVVTHLCVEGCSDRHQERRELTKLQQTKEK
jgi:predicted site-specific integrase-resolvase